MTYTYRDDQMISLPNGEIAWAGFITSDKGPVCKVWNKGDGGCNYYEWASADAQRDFLEVSMSEYPDTLEPLDAYVEKLWEISLGDIF